MPSRPLTSSAALRSSLWCGPWPRFVQVLLSTRLSPDVLARWATKCGVYPPPRALADKALPTGREDCVWASRKAYAANRWPRGFSFIQLAASIRVDALRPLNENRRLPGVKLQNALCADAFSKV